MKECVREIPTKRRLIMSSRRLVATAVLAASLATALAATAPESKAAVSANVDISFGARVPIDDDQRIFLSIQSRHFHREPVFVDQWAARFRNPDDLSVFLYFVKNSNASPQEIYDMRRRGMSWFKISQRLRMPVQTFFVRLDAAPIAPFERVYTRYDRLRRNPRYRMTLSDSDIRNLVVLRTMIDYYGIRPFVAMRLRASGRDARYLMVQEYRRRHDHEYDRAGRWHGRDRDDDRYDRDHDRDHDRYDRDYDRDDR
jgi:hypothetical protein